MKITSVRAIPLSYRYPTPGAQFGLGQSFKRDVALVRVEAEGGLVGYGESHHAMAAAVVCEYNNSTLSLLSVGEDVFNSEGIWNRIYRRTVRTHSLASGTTLAMSGLDMAIWDLKGKALGVPLYKLLGGERKPIPTYSGSNTMGYLEPSALVDEVHRIVETGGYRAVKLRIGDTPANDVARVTRVREEFGPDFGIMTDANTTYDRVDLYRLLPGLGAAQVTWLEEPVAPDDVQTMAEIRRLGLVPLAAGENHFGRSQLAPLIQARAVDILQADPSKCGGITELKKIADLAEMNHLRLAPHITHSALNHAASLHVLSSTSSAYYFESHVPDNPFVDEVIRGPVRAKDGVVFAPDGPGLGVDVDESRFDEFPLIPGPSYRWA
jgi:L-alanine-DL-glutamate epimerase-like enolase superfamily enzyme